MGSLDNRMASLQVLLTPRSTVQKQDKAKISKSRKALLVAGGNNRIRLRKALYLPALKYRIQANKYQYRIKL